MIEPLRKGEPYPGRLPPLRAQWRRVRGTGRAAIVGAPLLLVAICFVADVRLGVVMAVLVFGAGAASAMYVKNRTDRHNAAVDRGEIPVVEDPRLEQATMASLDPSVLGRLAALDLGHDDIGDVTRFDGGWIVKRRTRGDVSVVVGEDGGWALFDPRWVDDLRAASEYRAGRGREPAGY